ncbi:hypothetical protein Q7P37_004745 [Cladosporium fusiforme]
MFGSKSNIFVSISPGYEYAQGEDKLYLRPHYVWMITVESPKHSLSGKRDSNPTHYSVVWDHEADRWNLKPVSPTNQGVIGSILIQKNASTTASKLFGQLERALQLDNPALQPELDDAHESESWMKSALHALQEDKTVQEFDVDLFMTFAQAYLDRRIDGDGPARIPYSRLHKDHSQKEKKSFWISYPQLDTHYDRSDVYGGLM